jgi:hypothetical protein
MGPCLGFEEIDVLITESSDAFLSTEGELTAIEERGATLFFSFTSNSPDDSELSTHSTATAAGSWDAVGGATYHIQVDALGSTWRLTDAATATVFSTSYEPFGRLCGRTGSLAGTERYTYVRERDNTDSGVTYLQSHKDDPEVGRFAASAGAGVGVASHYIPELRPYTDPVADVFSFVPLYGDVYALGYYGTQGGLDCAAGSCDPLAVGLNLGGSIPIVGDLGKAVKLGGAGIGFLGLVTKGGRHADEFLDPRTIRFTQDSVSRFFGRPVASARSIDELAEGLRTGRIVPGNVPPIRVVEYHGLRYTLDNRRLVAFQKAGVPVPVTYVDFASHQVEFWRKFGPPLQGGTRILVRGVGLWP